MRVASPPAVVIAGFGADVINFEIRAIIRDVNYGVQTRSEINREIARRFLEEDIRTAAPPPALSWRADRVTLFESQLRPGTPIYTARDTIALKR